MTEQRPLPPPLGVARLGGAMYLVIIVLGISGEVFVRQRLIVANDAMATAANIRAHELLWRWSVATHAVGAVSMLDGLGALFPGVVVVMAATIVPNSQAHQRVETGRAARFCRRGRDGLVAADQGPPAASDGRGGGVTVFRVDRRRTFPMRGTRRANRPACCFDLVPEVGVEPTLGVNRTGF